MFMENGYSATTYKMIANELKTSSGHIRLYFSSKEELLAVLANMLCDFQWELMKKEANDKISSLLAICLELMPILTADYGFSE